MKLLVTGAGSGIGRALLELLSTDRDDSHHVIGVDLADEPLGEVTRELTANAGGRHTFVPLCADVGRAESAAEICKVVKTELGGLDGFVSNAAVNRVSPLLDLSVEEFNSTIEINTRATWLISRALYPLLCDSRGSIVATASIGATHPAPNQGVYSVSKAALLMLMRQMANEWGPTGIRCNVVSPGATHTGMSERAYSDSAVRSRREQMIPLRRIGQASDVARAIKFLLSSDSGQISGANLSVDGGLDTMLLSATGSPTSGITSA